MKKHFILFYFFISSITLFSQNDSLKVNQSYWEDQLYINVTYNLLYNQPENVEASKVSYGVSFGYIKDIPLNKSNTFALGIGVGYNYDLYSHSLVYQEGVFVINDETSSNRMRLHNLEFPLQIRWRTSDAVTYSFWRVYLGMKLNYNMSNKFSYQEGGVNYESKNIDIYNSFQSGLELSAGYRGFNFYIYYGLLPIYNEAILNDENINSRVLKLGLIFYLL